MQKEIAEAASRAAEKERQRAEEKERRLVAAQAHALSLEEKIAELEKQAAQAAARISPSADNPVKEKHSTIQCLFLQHPGGKSPSRAMIGVAWGHSRLMGPTGIFFLQPMCLLICLVAQLDAQDLWQGFEHLVLPVLHH